MRNAGMTTHRIAVATSMLAVGMFVAVAALVAFPQNAAALPTYAQKEGKPCGFCHVNPAGGGERNAMGKKYEAGGHSFKK